MPELNQLIKENNYQQEDSICLTTGLPGIF